MRSTRPHPVAAGLAAEFADRVSSGRVSSTVDALAATAAAERDPLVLEHLARAEVARFAAEPRPHRNRRP